MEKILIYAPGKEFLMPYLNRVLSPAKIVGLDDTAGAEMAVMISSCDVYGEGEHIGVGEETAVDTSSVWYMDEEKFRKAVVSLPAFILRCPNIVGTGMTGYPAELAASIWRGLFFHFPGNEARLSTVHASDVAELVGILASKEPEEGVYIYNVSDGTDSMLHDFVEALAYRMRNKRVSTLSTRPQQWFGRKVYGSRYVKYTTTRTFSSERLRAAFPEFHPHEVTEYLRTHVYDETSL